MCTTNFTWATPENGARAYRFSRQVDDFALEKLSPRVKRSPAVHSPEIVPVEVPQKRRTTQRRGR